jgi:hypothetical protein
MGAYDSRSPYYIVSLVFHDQAVDISDDVKKLDEAMRHQDNSDVAIHTAPLIRRESEYKYLDISKRKKIFNSIFAFFRKTDISYTTIKVEKKHIEDSVELSAILARQLSAFLKENFMKLSEFDYIYVYYDKGQLELNRMLASVFHSVLGNVEFKKDVPSDARLFQVADLCCTLELLRIKAESKSFSRSESFFFNSLTEFKKLYIPTMKKKLF